MAGGESSDDDDMPSLLDQPSDGESDDGGGGKKSKPKPKPKPAVVVAMCKECDEVPEGELQNSLGDRPASHATFAFVHTFDGACYRCSNTKFGATYNRVVFNGGKDHDYYRSNLHRRTNSVHNNLDYNFVSTFMSVPSDFRTRLSMAGEGIEFSHSKLHKRLTAASRFWRVHSMARAFIRWRACILLARAFI